MDTHVTEWIYRLVDFAIAKDMVEAQDRAFYVNRILEAMRMDAPEEIDFRPPPSPRRPRRCWTRWPPKPRRGASSGTAAKTATCSPPN